MNEATGVRGPSAPSSVDPTRIHLDPTENGWRHVTAEGYPEPFDITFMSHIEGNLWTGGCAQGLVLPVYIEHVVSLYPWEQYVIEHQIKSYSLNWMYDSRESEYMFTAERLWAIARYASACVDDGPTLVHCQAGINRSGLIGSMILMLRGRTVAEAIDLMRSKRSPAVLCNRTFRRWLIGTAP